MIPEVLMWCVALRITSWSRWRCPLWLYHRHICLCVLALALTWCCGLVTRIKSLNLLNFKALRWSVHGQKQTPKRAALLYKHLLFVSQSPLWLIGNFKVLFASGKERVGGLPESLEELGWGSSTSPLLTSLSPWPKKVKKKTFFFTYVLVLHHALQTWTTLGWTVDDLIWLVRLIHSQVRAVCRLC